MLTQKKKFKLPQISSVCINGIMVFVLLVVLVPMLNLCCFANKLRKIFIQSAKKKRRLKGF